MAKHFKNIIPIYVPAIDLNGNSSGIDISMAWTEGDGATTISPGGLVTYRANLAITGIAIVGGSIVDAGEVLRVGGITFPLSTDDSETVTIGSTSCTITYTASTKTFAITPVSGSLPLADARTALRSVQYDHNPGTHTSGDRVFSFIALGVGGRESVPAVATVSVTAAANEPPSVLLGGSTLNTSGTFTEGDVTISLCASAVVSDADDTDLSSIAFDITGTTADDEIVKWASVEFPVDTTATTTCTAGATTFSVAYNGTTKSGTITKNGGGVFPLADAQSLLRTLAYVNDSSPLNAGTRTITIAVNDGLASSDDATITITVLAVGAPELSRVPPMYCARNQTIRSYTITNTGTSGTYSLTSGTLPTGLSLNTTTGEISGTVGGAATVTTNTVTITCTNSNGSDSVTFGIKVFGSYTNITSATTFPYYTAAADRLYVLTENVAADTSGFVFIHSGCWLDLNGYTLTYSNKPAVTVANHSFETGSGSAATGWDFTNAPNAVRHAATWLYNECYDGDYSLKFNNTTLSEYVENTTTVTLEANTYYSVSAMFEYGGQNDWTNPGVKGYVQLIGSGLTTREVYWNQSNYRGIQLQETTFKTGATDETYTVRVGIVGHASATRPFFIDDIRIQQSKAYGVTVGPKSWTSSLYPELTAWGSAANCGVSGGSIIDGTNPAMWGHAVYIENNLFNLHDTTVTIHGHCASCVYKDASSSYSYSAQIYYNTFDSEVTTITTRDYFFGTVLFGVLGDIYNNTITNGPHCGVYIGATESVATSVYNNTIALKSRYTNAFAIVGGRGAQIYNNTINCGTGEYAARGIGSSYGLPTRTSRIYNNTIVCQELATNQEYQGISYGVYGIQVESGRYVEIYGNDVTVNAVDTLHRAFAFRINEAMAGPVSVHNNVFRFNATDGHGAVLKMSRLSGGPFTFEDNELVTNDGIIGASTETGTVDLVRCTIEMGTPVASAYVFESDYSALSTLHSVWRLQDTVFADVDSETRLYAGDVHTQRSYGASYDIKAAAELRWTATVHAKDGSNNNLVAADITVEDSTTATEATGVTDSNGDVSIVLRERRRTGSGLVTYTPHDISGVSGALTGTVSATIDSTETVQLTLT